MKIAIVTDSTSDIPVHIAEEYDIHVLPTILNIDGQSVEDGMGISRSEFYERLPGMEPLPTTSAPSVGSFLKLYEKLFQQGATTILSIHAPEALSGIYNAARLAAHHFGERVHVVDSGLVTLGLGFQVIAASEASRKESSIEEVVARIEAVRKRTHIMAMLDTFEYIRRSGRVTWATATLGSLLNIKPFISLKDGVVHRLGETRTRMKGIARLRDMLQAFDPLECLAIIHSNVEDDALQFLASLNMKISTAPMIVNITPIIGTHVGPKGLGFVAVSID